MKSAALFFLLVNSVLSSPFNIQSQNFSSSQFSGVGLFLENEDAHLTVPDIITKYRYPVEIHEVQTDDGYILTLHRIPHGKDSVPAEGLPVVLLQHGMLCDSASWILNTEKNALAFVLANSGYDVWMGNSRGNTYSRKHITIPTDDRRFWDFSWHEMGIYDIPATVDYILQNTGSKNLHYIGHSMGSTSFFVAMAEKPELNSKIRLMTALGPVAYTQHMNTPIRLIAPFANQIEWLLRMIGQNEFLPSSRFMDFMGASVCRDNNPLQALCSNVLFLVGGYNPDQMNATMIPIILGHTPAGTSTRAVVHYAQEYSSKEFRQYDYGLLRNFREYGARKPPKYNLSKVTAPVALMWGQNDLLASPKDVKRLADELPNVRRNYRVNHNNYNHLDFIWAKDNDYLLNSEILEFMKRY